MAGAASTKLGDPGRYVVSHRMRTVFSVCMFLGLVGLVVGLMRDPSRTWMSYLIAFFYFMSLALGGLFFTALQHAVKAGWSVNIRRLCEGLTAFLPFGAIAAALFLVGAPYLYTWLDSAKVAADPLLQHKASYLNGPFFVVRLVAFFALWLGFKKVIVGRSIQQDQTGDESLTLKQVSTSVAFLIVFALSFSLFSVDFIMTTEPHWFSTIFGVYLFAGLFQMTMAFTILMVIYLQRKGHLIGWVKPDHMHDLGKFLFAFTVFWAYVAFSQYMLIWYANLPEETLFIIPRSEGGWAAVSVLLILGKFVVPFLALLPRWAKRTPAHLGAVSIWILIMQYVDIYWLVYPSYFHEQPKFGLYEILIFAGFLGVFLFALTRFLGRNNLVPIKDPRIQESMHHHVVY